MLELIKSDTFWAALSALATLAGVFAILFAARQLRFEAWVKAVDIWSSKEFTENRKNIFGRLQYLQAPWEPKDYDIGLEVCRRIDEFVRLAPYMGQRRMLEVWGDGLAKAWVVLEPLVSGERIVTTQPTKWDAFEKLGKNALSTRPHLQSRVAQTTALRQTTEESRREATRMERILLKGRWRLVGGVVLFPLLCFGALRFFHRHTFLATMTLDGFALFGATIFAAILGFGAVLLQIRSSAAQLRQQSADQHDSARREQQRRVAAIAMALLVEIQDFRKYYITGIGKLLTELDVAILTKESLPWLGSHPFTRFEIYAGNVGRIGELDKNAVESVVRFYKTASEHLAGYEDYRMEFSRLNEPSATSETYENAKYCLEIVWRSLRSLFKLADDACKELERVATSSAH